MRKILTIFAVVLLIGKASKAQYVTIYNMDLRSQLQSIYPSCFNSLGQMDTTCTEIINEDTLSLNSFAFDTTIINGLQYFKNLRSLNLNMYSADIRRIDSFPRNLFSLKIDILYFGLQLPTLPPSLKTFRITGYGILQSLPELPSGLEILDLDNASYTSIPALPSTLRYLRLSQCTGATQLPSFPASLEDILISEAFNITGPLPALPPALKNLAISGFFTGITSFPAGLLRLNSDGCARIGSLPPLPQGLKMLSCRYDSLDQLPALPNSLDSIDCSINNITSLPTLPTNLSYLKCGNNNFSTLPALPSTLLTLNCAFTSIPASVNASLISSLPALPNSLRNLICSNNALTNLPALSFTSLQRLECARNQLTNLPDLPASLNYLEVSFNSLSSLPSLNSALQSLWCTNNQITLLPVLPDSMKTISCSNNQLTMLPDLPHALNFIDCSFNQLSSIPPLPGTLTYLGCFGNNNLYCLPAIPKFVSSPQYNNFSADHLEIESDPNKITCLPNYRPGLIVNSQPSLPPLCNPVNNINQCQSFPVMQGSVYYDNNNNNIKDANEPVRKNLQITLSTGSYTFTNNNGFYEIGADSIGTFNITSTAPRYFDAVPPVVYYNFSTYDTLVIKDIALQANTIIDELTVRITPINWAARPGYSFPYLISYENTGTTTISPDIIFDYDQERLNYNTSSVAGVLDNTNVLSYNTGALQPGESGSFTSYFTLKTTVPLGDTLNAKASIAANLFSAYDSVQTIVRGAFDPNDKQATPQLSPSQVVNGNNINYTIRFQNTGTDTAFIVVISDTLSDDLQAGTLQMAASSHNCKTTVNGNVVFFEFLNILLPDSNVNEPKSHGFVSFSIKPRAAVAANTTILNKAAIYFDYNSPVITNTAATLIKEFTTVPLKLISFNAVPQNDHTVSLYWSTTNEINTQQFAIERSGDGLHFTAVTTVPAKEGSVHNNYGSTVADALAEIVFYRLKIIDRDGSYAYSPVIKIDRRKIAAGIAIVSNPVKDEILVSTTGRSLANSQASIINMQGAVVKTFIVKAGSQVVDIKELAAGVYYLRTMTGSRRFIKQ